MGTGIPRWLSTVGFTLSSRPRLPIDELDEGGTALDTVKHRPGQRYKSIKKASKRLREAEEWSEYIRNRVSLRNTGD